ncbi:hypothetical protein BH20ACT5_BH20ACT5_16350 [soil metagenome]
MNRADYLTKPCPSWCVQMHRPDRLCDDIKIHETTKVRFIPEAGRGLEPGTGDVEAYPSSHETLEDNGPSSSPTFFMLYATDVELTSAEARQVAALLLDQAGRLDGLRQQ